MIGNEEDFTACLGFEVDETNSNLTHLSVEKFKNMINKAAATLAHDNIGYSTGQIINVDDGMLIEKL